MHVHSPTAHDTPYPPTFCSLYKTATRCTTTENMNSIQSIINGHQPPLESEVCQYIANMVELATEDGDEIDVDVLSNFLSEDESMRILSVMQSQKEAATGTKTKSPHMLRLQIDDTYASTSPTPKTTPTKTKSQLRKEARLKKKSARQKKNKVSDISELVNDDHASSWAECQKGDRLWGGRGHGGRGIRITGDNLQNIHLPSVTLSFEGNELLVDSKMDIVKGHRYGLLGRNGVGKSTLLRQLAAGSIPGLPRGMIIQMVKQQVEGREDQTTLEALVEADEYRTSLLQEQEQVERELDAGINLEDNAQRIGDVAVELDAIDADSAEERAKQILKGLCFTQGMIHGPTINLSGGWRMR